MIIEEVLPLLRKGKSIKRTRKSHNQALLVISFFMENFVANIYSKVVKVLLIKNTNFLMKIY